MSSTKILEAYNKACTALAHEFFSYYLGKDYDHDGVDQTLSRSSHMWQYADKYWEVKDMETILWDTKKYTPEFISEWYNYNLDCEDEYRLGLWMFFEEHLKYEEFKARTKHSNYKTISFIYWYKEKKDRNKAYRELVKQIAKEESNIIKK